MKKSLFVLAMVLLSTGAWGQGKYQGPPKDVLIIGGMNGPKELTMEWHIANMHPEWVKSGNTVHMWYEHKSGVSFTAPDPTAWKQTKQRDITGYPAPILDCRLRCADSKGVVNPECESACLGQKPWGDSRYRLEKNSATGELRISEKQKREWVPIGDQYGLFFIQNSVFGPRWHSEKQMFDWLDELRAREKQEGTWRPIK